MDGISHQKKKMLNSRYLQEGGLSARTEMATMMI